METGTIVEWNKKEGETINPGDIICEFETDKATVSFEAQDDQVLAKILAPEGTSDIKVNGSARFLVTANQVGDPIMVVVEEGTDISAFKDFTLDSSASQSSAPPKEPSPQHEEQEL